MASIIVLFKDKALALCCRLCCCWEHIWFKNLINILLKYSLIGLILYSFCLYSMEKKKEKKQENG